MQNLLCVFGIYSSSSFNAFLSLFCV
jgi:hypothetical protein